MNGIMKKVFFVIIKNKARPQYNAQHQAQTPGLPTLTHSVWNQNHALEWEDKEEEIQIALRPANLRSMKFIAQMGL